MQYTNQVQISYIQNSYINWILKAALEIVCFDIAKATFAQATQSLMICPPNHAVPHDGNACCYVSADDGERSYLTREGFFERETRQTE